MEKKHYEADTAGSVRRGKAAYHPHAQVAQWDPQLGWLGIEGETTPAEQEVVRAAGPVSAQRLARLLEARRAMRGVKKWTRPKLRKSTEPAR